MRLCATTLDSELTLLELDFLLKTLRQNNLAGKHLEIGTAAGGTLWQMICSSKDMGRSPQFVAVDPMTYFPNQLEFVKQNLKEHSLDPDTVDFRVTSSDAAFRQAVAAKEHFDFIFIDANHKICYVMEDLRWTRLLNAGGILMLHDCGTLHKGVKLSVERFLRGYGNYSVIGQVETLIAIRKTETTHSKEISLLDRLYAQAWSPILQLEKSFQKRRTKK